MTTTEKLQASFSEYYESLIAKVPELVEGALVLILFMLLAAVVRRITSKRLESRTEDVLRARFIARVVRTAIILLGLTLAMKAAGYGEIAAGLMAGAGVSAFVIGFALKDIGENFLAGFLLSFSRPFRVNDIIEVDGFKGKVKALNLRNTHIKTFDGKDIFMPNATLIKNPLQNYTLDGYLRQEFTIGVDYSTDFAKAREVLQEVIDQNHAIAKNHAASSISYASLGASSYNIKIQYWQDMFDSPVAGSVLKTSLVEECLAALADNDIGTPGDIIELRPLPKIVTSDA
jgi:small-conductance mechanosensitive channel